MDDAPLLLMISDTFVTLIMNTKRTEIRSTATLLKTRGFIWQEQVVSVMVLGLVGLFILKNPLAVFKDLFDLIIPRAIICLAVFILVRAIRARAPEDFRARELSRAPGIFGAGLFASLLPLALWVIFILAVLAVWMIASAGMLLRRVAKGCPAVPEGFSSRMAIGISSLALSVLLLICPAGILGLLVEILGAITVLLGITLFTNGLRLKNAMNGSGSAR